MDLSSPNSGHLVWTCFFHWLGSPASCCHHWQTCPTIHSEISSRKENIIRRTETRQIGWTITVLLLVILACRKHCYPKLLSNIGDLSIHFGMEGWGNSPTPPPPPPAQLPTTPQKKILHGFVRIKQFMHSETKQKLPSDFCSCPGDPDMRL